MGYNLLINGVYGVITLFPRDPITEHQMMIGVYNHLLSKVFRFRYHSQKVIGSLGIMNLLECDDVRRILMVC